MQLLNLNIANKTKKGRNRPTVHCTVRCSRTELRTLELDLKIKLLAGVRVRSVLQLTAGVLTQGTYD